MAFLRAILIAPLLLFVWMQGALAVDAQSALTLRVAGDELRTRIVILFDQKPEITPFLLAHPHRLVLDMPQTRFGFDPDAAKDRGLVQMIRYGAAGEQRSRMVVSLRGPFKVEGFQILQNEVEPGYRLVADIVAVSDREFDEALTQQQGSRQSDPVPITQSESSGEKPFTIMIDPGHGGIDSGAASVGGLLEKDLTLAFARELRTRLGQEPNMRVLMTRDDDLFLRLGERVRLARQHEADLFISIHADTVNQHNIRGATVYTISDKASDSVARAMAERENRSDLLGDIPYDEQPQVSDILLDLTRRETHGFSLDFAEKLIASLSGEVNLINNPHRYAGFQVLRAPDVPSILLEIGYLSNPEDEKLISDPQWRKRLADRLALAISQYAAHRSLLSFTPAPLR